MVSTPNTEISEGKIAESASNMNQQTSGQSDLLESKLKEPSDLATSSSTSDSLQQIPSVIEVSSSNRQADVKKNPNTDSVFFFAESDVLKNILSPSTDEKPAIEEEKHDSDLLKNDTARSQPLGKGESAIFCRICHEVGSTDLFISPCDCKGSLSVVHKRCLERWLAESNSNFCELCGFEYNVMRLAKCNVVVSMFSWVWAANNVRSRRLLIFDLITLSLVFPLAVFATMLGIKAVAHELPTMAVYALTYTRFLQFCLMGFVLSLDIFVLAWAGIRIQYHFFMWLEWHRKNCNVHLLGYPEPQTAPIVPVPHASSATVREIQF